ncbi:hypothetical protein SCE1572_16135 [Sorangium cellulosum So0157-2]|uniref:Uncharacterized protein n=1 Tax=Sorangium cellulosum So0157-2 TaxID=1254432 RepID=S4XU63_SORCE|nr:hypothetical protein SCE1572_16135 [Sorangium cellulosum So0157-2]
MLLSVIQLAEDGRSELRQWHMSCNVDRCLTIGQRRNSDEQEGTRSSNLLCQSVAATPW